MTIDMPTLVLILFAVYRGTLLVTGDRVTRAPRRAIRRYFRHRLHHLESSSRDERRCSCGWHVRHQRSEHGTYVISSLVAEPIPKGTPMDAVELDLDWVLARHIEQGRDQSKVAFLLECPWCVSMYLGTIAAAVYWAWPTGWWRWGALALSASGVAGLGATIAAPDENDPED